MTRHPLPVRNPFNKRNSMLFGTVLKLRNVDEIVFALSGRRQCVRSKLLEKEMCELMLYKMYIQAPF